MFKVGGNPNSVANFVKRAENKTKPAQKNLKKLKQKPDVFEKSAKEKIEEKCPGYSLMNIIAEMLKK